MNSTEFCSFTYWCDFYRNNLICRILRKNFKILRNYAWLRRIGKITFSNFHISNCFNVRFTMHFVELWINKQSQLIHCAISQHCVKYPGCKTEILGGPVYNVSVVWNVMGKHCTILWRDYVVAKFKRAYENNVLSDCGLHHLRNYDLM